MKIENHKLVGEDGESIKYQQTPNTGGSFGEGLPDTIIMHYTAGASVGSSVKTLTNPNNEASAHMVIGRDGGIVQLAPFNVITWHAGPSSYKGREGLNQYAIGIEMDNAGLLEQQGEQFVSWFGRKYTREEVVKAVHRNQSVQRYWHEYTEQQIQTAFNVCQLLTETYAIEYLAGHEEIAPKRKKDPGPAFPLDQLRQEILEKDLSQNSGEPDTIPEDGQVIASALNIRSNPSSNAKKVAKPLPEGTKVTIQEARSGWYHVKTQIEGWVSADYIE